MSDIFREVDEELRRDQLYGLWKRYSWQLIAGALAVVLGVAGVRGYQWWDRTQAGESGARFSQALDLLAKDDGEAAQAAQAALAGIAGEGYGAYPTLAKMREAAALGARGKRDAAIEIYDLVAADDSVSEMLSDLASVRAALLLVDEATPETMRSRLGALADADGPWRHTARELIALNLYRSGDYAGADVEYDRIMGDPAAPIGLRGRAEMMRALIAPHLTEVGQ